ncbi:MAG: RNA methyltransferase [Planctomycetota bacterium]|nr:RNA methyltransferase [Planctomycetota bacterium]
MPPTEKLVSSPQNDWVKEIVELRKDGEARRERQRFFLEGRKAVEAALEADGAAIHELVYCEHLWRDESWGGVVEKARAQDVPLVRVSKDVFRKLADVMEPQGLAAVVKMAAWTLEDLLAKPDALIVVACGIQDPGNLGTIVRSLEACGGAGLVSLENTADAYNAKVIRSTAAALLSLPIVRAKTGDFLKEAARRKLRLAATAAADGVAYKAFDWKKRPLALCIGSEGEGLPVAVEQACGERVTIPMRGRAESLNAAVAASILLFEAQSR